MKRTLLSTLTHCLIACGLLACSPPLTSRPAAREALSVSLSLGLRTQFADPEGLRYLRIVLKGQGLSQRLPDQGEFVPVVNGMASASFSDLPVQSGALRFVLAQGYDRDRQALPAFEAGASYRSGSTNRLTVSRSRLLAVKVLDELYRTRPAVLNQLDPAALQALTDQLIGLTAGRFSSDPSRFDAVALAALIGPDGALPGANNLSSRIGLSAHDLSFRLRSPQGGFLGEDLLISVGDPLSPLLRLAKGLPDAGAVRLTGVGPGSWPIEARRTDGSLAAKGKVTLGADGNAVFEPAELMLEGIQEWPAIDVTAAAGAHAQVLDTEGRQLLLWQDSDGMGSGIAARRYDADQLASGPVFRVNNQLTGDQVTPALAGNGSGSVAIWAGPLGLCGQIYAPDGTPRGGEFSFAAGDSARDPAVALDAAGRFVVIWAGQAGLSGQRFTATGSPVGAVFSLRASAPQSPPALGMATGGEFVAVWAGSQGVEGQRFSALAQPLGAALSFGPTGTEPALAVSPGGEFVVTWTEAGSLKGRWHDLAGSPAGADFSLGSGRTSAVAIEPDGDFVASWQQDAEIRARRYRREGQARGEAFSVGPAAPQGRPRIAASGTQVRVSWLKPSPAGGIGLATQRIE